MLKVGGLKTVKACVNYRLRCISIFNHKMLLGDRFVLYVCDTFWIPDKELPHNLRQLQLWEMGVFCNCFINYFMQTYGWKLLNFSKKLTFDVPEMIKDKKFHVIWKPPVSKLGKEIMVCNTVMKLKYKGNCDLVISKKIMIRYNYWTFSKNTLYA